MPPRKVAGSPLFGSSLEGLQGSAHLQMPPELAAQVTAHLEGLREVRTPQAY
jgi:hypothetical protein